MNITRYTSAHRQACIDIFESNQPRYFAEEEKPGFVQWLDDYTDENPYFVVKENDEVVACGGIFLDGELNEAGLAWGMVRASHHKQGYGKQFTLYRLALLRETWPGSVHKIETSQHTEGFYAKMGFRTVAIEKDGFAAGIDKHIMHLSPKPSG
ncbi:GNAT family N-acetyltransferase [Chitinophaga barathri]|uniref:N-acetyltransferase n=1 Tax=Chitinophaga barathri TaxID=1647451 RepID=A0A3N4MHE4_9BACT|nr:GNAT family N-acetyltransferase [Chitinophaga barathri]RPD43311.1 N-acetyltransferase [Chitinophaga barathri]